MSLTSHAVSGMPETEDLQKEIDQAHEKLRSIDSSIAAINGRTPGTLKRRITNDEFPGAFSNNRRSGEFRDRDGPVRRDVVVRPRISFDEVPLKRARDDQEDHDDFVASRKSLPSQVVMPAIETKSRDAAITEMRDKEVKAVKQRNRRLFGSLLVGTLQRFQKDEKKIATAEKAQAEKVAEVEKRLEEEKREEKEKAYQEKGKLLAERREQERNLKALQRKKALIQYAEEKTSHYKRLQNFIGTKTSPTIFYLPAKPTLQSLELVKTSAARLQELIDARNEELQKELEGGGMDHYEEDENKGLRSHIRQGDESDREEEEEEEEEKEKEGDERANAGHVEVRVEGEESDEEEDKMEVKVEQ